MYQDKDLVEKIYRFDKPQKSARELINYTMVGGLILAQASIPLFYNFAHASESLEGDNDFLAPTQVYNPEGDMEGSVWGATKEYFKKLNPNKVEVHSDPIEAIKKDYSKAGKDLEGAVKNLITPKPGIKPGQNILDLLKGVLGAGFKGIVSPILRPVMHGLGELGSQSENKGDIMSAQIMNFFGDYLAWNASTIPLPTSYIVDKSPKDTFILMGLINPDECYQETTNEKTCNKTEAFWDLTGLGIKSALLIWSLTAGKSGAAPSETTTTSPGCGLFCGGGPPPGGG